MTYNALYCGFRFKPFVWSLQLFPEVVKPNFIIGTMVETEDNVLFFLLKAQVCIYYNNQMVWSRHNNSISA